MEHEVLENIIKMERKNSLIATLENLKYDLIRLDPSLENLHVIRHMEDKLYPNDNFRVSNEDLDGEKQNFLTRMGKSLTNVAGELGDVIHNTLDMFKDYDMSSINYLVDLENKLKQGKVEVLTKEVFDTGINKKLGIYFSMHTEFNTSSFRDFINIPSKLFLEHDLIDNFIKYGKEYLIEEKSSSIPNMEESIRIIDNIHIPEIRKWLHKDTKVALLNRISGNTMNIMSLQIDRNNEAEFRNDHFRIDSSYYYNKTISIDNRDLIELINICVDSSKHFMENMLMIKKLNYNSITEQLDSDAKSVMNKNASNLDKVKRLYRNVSVMCNVIRSLQLIDVYMMHSVIDLYNCIEKLAKASLKESNKRIEDDEA